MISSGLSGGDSFIHGLDPRARILVCVLFLVLCASVSSFPALGAAFALSTLATALAKIPPAKLLARAVFVNAFLIAMFATSPGRDGFFALTGGLPDGAGARLLELTLRCNAMLLFASALAGTIETSAFGHALAHFGVPDKLSHLFLFSIGQTEALAKERERLQDAMKARAFRPANSAHCYKSLANLASMILLRGVERAERLSEALRCRNFKGRFHLFDHFKMRGADWAFVAAAGVALLALVATEATCKLSR